MVAYDRLGMDPNRKDLAQLVDARIDNRLAMFEGLSGVTVDSAKPSTPHASRNAVVGAGLAGFE